MALVSLTSDCPFSMAALSSSSVSFSSPRSRALHNSALGRLTSFPSYSFPVSLRCKPLNTARTALLNPGTRCMLESKDDNIKKIADPYQYLASQRVTRTMKDALSELHNEIGPQVVTKDSWNKMVLNSEAPVLVEFYANWCGPCRMVHRLIDEIAVEYGGRLQCYVLNTDKDLQVAVDYEIKAVPVVMLFKNGEKCESVVGTMPKEFYVAAIERVLKQYTLLE